MATPISVHASMSKVSSTFRDIARRRLYHTLVIGDEDGSLGITGDDPTLDDATWVKSPQRFLESHSGHQDWKSCVRRVYVQCGILRGRPVLVLGPEVEVETEYSNAISAYEAEDTLIRKIGSLFTDSNSMSGLKFCHTIMTGAGAPFWQPNPPACGVTSLTMSILDESEYESWETLVEIFRMPTLRFLEIMGWDDTARPIEDDFHDPGMSNVTHLMLTQCGALNTEMIPLLQWPKDLQRLRIKSGLPTYDDEDSDLGDWGDVSIQEAVDTIQPLKDTLLELDFDPGDSRNWTEPMEPLQSRAFSNFTKLQRLNAPLEIFADSMASMRSHPTHVFHTNFPSSLEKLTLDIMYEGPLNYVLERAETERRVRSDGTINQGGEWVRIEDLPCRVGSSEPFSDDQSHEMFAELAQLAEHRSSHPALSEIRLLGYAYQWLDCEHIQSHARVIEQSGITVIVDQKEESSRSLIGSAIADERRTAGLEDFDDDDPEPVFIQ
ncbi:hypothetical protein D6C90_05261 [Aureobasidium pullulans]|uniref:F-box domain-containing protein n=1 Tax=Aureobasidium pullulans TaxID=5580 RepID=A0A4V4KQN0_AURPU|nr:hypothetical protein D6C90_05261 [Aureobasidium pullulans]